MAGLDPTDAIEAIEAKLAEIGQAVYSAQVPDEALSPTDASGLINPFYVVRFGGPVRAAKGKNITTSRDHVNIMFLTVACMAATEDAVKWLFGQALDKLVGFVPPNSGELILEGGLSYSEGISTVKPTKYLKDINFTFRTNLTLNSSV